MWNPEKKNNTMAHLGNSEDCGLPGVECAQPVFMNILRTIAKMLSTLGSL